MKRNLETIRDILIRLESYNDTEVSREDSYHLQELINQGLVSAIATMADGRHVYYQGLTLSWEGHELLASISNGYVWYSIKGRLHEHELTVNDVPVAIVKKLSEQIMMEMFGG